MKVHIAYKQGDYASIFCKNAIILDLYNREFSPIDFGTVTFDEWISMAKEGGGIYEQIEISELTAEAIFKELPELLL